MVTLSLPALVLVAGILMYGLANNYPKVQELGRIMFFVGLFVLLLVATPQVVSLFN